jgi:hypothetical protein
MWLYGYHVGFTEATVIQKRNPHDYVCDLISEVPMYEHSEHAVEIVTEAISKNKSIEQNLYMSYEALLKFKIIKDEEIKSLTAWLNDVSYYSS